MTTKFIKDLVSYKGGQLSTADRQICRWLASGLSQTEIDDLMENINGEDWCLCRILEECPRPVFEPQERNRQFEPNKGWRFYLDTLRKRRIGQVQSSRNRLREMFSHIEYTGQMQILRFCLFEATKDDRIWALKTIQYQPALIRHGSLGKQSQWRKDILEIWNRFHDIEAARLITEVFPLGEVLSMENELSESLGYKTVVRRLWQCPDFTIDPNRLSELEWFYYMAKAGRQVPPERAKDILLTQVKEVKNDSKCPFHPKSASLLSDSRIAMALKANAALGNTDLVIRFYTLDCRLQALTSQTYKVKWNPEDQETCDAYWTAMCALIPSVFFPKDVAGSFSTELRSFIEELGIDVATDIAAPPTL